MANAAPVTRIVAVGWHTSSFPLYLTHIDVVLRYTWIGLCLGFPYDIDSARLENALRGLLRMYTSLAGSLVQQLQPHRVFSGEEAPFKLQITQLSDGCALGISISHLLADAESLGQMLADLSSLYNGQGLPQRQETRLGMQQIISKAAGLLSSEAQSSGRCLEKLRDEILHSSVAKQAGVDYISHTDVTCALLWVIKEASSGNHLKDGVHQAISNIMGLRSSGFSDLKPNPYFGNALSIALIQPLPLTQSTGDCGLRDTVAAAACAVRLATRTFRSDVASSVKQLFAALPALVQAEVLQNPDMNPFKGCCLDVVSWRNMYNKVDFGQGPPVLTLGGALPTLINISFIMEGPGRDGVLCTLWFSEVDFERLRASQLLHQVAPEATFVKGHPS
ncbi:hypothetical protein WJX79_006544 [Trebouxia sp. C0005]